MNQLPLIDRARMHADSVAVRCESQSHTYQELLAHSEAIATALIGSSTDLHESRVALLVPAGFHYVTTQWGIWRAGGVAVPLSLSATEQELEYTLSDSQCSRVLTTRSLAAKVAAVCHRLELDSVIVDDIDTSLRAAMPVIDADRRAMILYTSGTTSRPKGVVTTHACIESQIESLVQAWHWQPEDRIPLFLPLHHIHGIINVMSCALWSGAQIEPFARFDTDTIVRRVSEGAYTVFMAVPTIYVKLIEALQAMDAQRRNQVTQGFGKMRLMVSGSAALPASVHQQWSELTSQDLLERYGMTEIGMALSNPYHGGRRSGTVGQPLPGVESRLCSEKGEVIGDENSAGEIQVRGPNVFLEYWNRPTATQESFHEDWFRTGDIATIEDGYYRILGRSSVDIIKSGGYKLSALEIESALLDHPSIQQCAVVGVPDAKWGEAVAAAIVLRAGHALTLEDLRAWCRERISTYKMPQQLRAVDELPRNAMGKITKPSVLKLFQ
jgi:malonyl-CoA/methylmalonyl-CoA synthetase